MTDIYSQQAQNRRNTFLLILFFFVFVAIVGVSVDVYRYGAFDPSRVPVPTVVALGFATINSIISYYYGSSIVLASLGAEPLNPDNLSHRKFHNCATEMALASGIPMPRLYVLNDPSPNAFATGRDPQNASIAVTQGLLDAMERDELQAVIAHEMGHIKSNDILLMTVVSVLIGTVSLLSDWAVRTWRYGGIRPRRSLKDKGLNPAALLVIALFVLISPFISRVIAMAVSRVREYQADTSAAEFTRNPMALATALEKIGQGRSPLRSARRGTAHLFISDPLSRAMDNKEGIVADVLSTHPPIEKRIERLKRMAYVFGKGTEAGQ
jgi:heat shock protein HtpX